MKYNWSCNVLGGDASQWTMLCKSKCYTYQLISSNRKKEKKKKSMRNPLNIYLSNCLLYCWLVILITQSETLYRCTWYPQPHRNEIKVWLLGALATFQVFSSNFYWIVQTQNISTITETFIGGHCFWVCQICFFLKNRNSSMSPLLPSGWNLPPTPFINSVTSGFSVCVAPPHVSLNDIYCIYSGYPNFEF